MKVIFKRTIFARVLIARHDRMLLSFLADSFLLFESAARKTFSAYFTAHVRSCFLKTFGMSDTTKSSCWSAASVIGVLLAEIAAANRFSWKMRFG